MTHTDSKIVCEDVWKVFGPNPHEIITNWKNYESLDKVARLEKTKCVVGTRQATFKVEKGEIYCLMGLSGSGKSTLVRCVNRLHEVTHGKIFIDGQDITALSEKKLREFRREKTGMVFQNFALLPHRRVLSNVALGLEIQGVEKTKREEKAREAIELVGLKGWEKNYPYELSGGMQQRVGLARALAPNPEVLLMDEAFSALDPLIRRQLQDEFVKLIKKVNKTIIFVTHDLNEALRIAGHIAIMKDGAIVQQGTPAEIVLNPTPGYVEEFVKDLPKIKFITAHDILQKPDDWLLGPDDSIQTMKEKLIRNDARFGILVDENRRLKKAVDFYKLRELEAGKTPDCMADADTCDFPVAEATPDMFLEALLQQGTATKVPIVVHDENNQIIGVITQEKLLASVGSN